MTAPALIESIRPIGPSGDRWAVRVGGRTVARAEREAIDRCGLAPGGAWDERVAAQLARERGRARARREAVRRLARRPLSRAELVARLARAGHAPGDVAEAVADAERAGLLDDADLAESIIAQARARGAIADRGVMQRLLRRGIPGSVADAALAALPAPRDSEEAALRLVERVVRAAPGAEPAALARRAAGRLARRGFDEEAIRAILRRADLPAEG